MLRGYAVSLGALAMALVVFRGAIRGELAGTVASEAIMAMLIFAFVGWIAGWIMEFLVRDSLEQAFRKRVEWYRQGMVDAGLIEGGDKTDSSTR